MSVYLGHRPDPDDKWSTACGGLWQYWQAPAGLALRTGVAILPPYSDPGPGDEIRTCPACMRVPSPRRVYQPRSREDDE